MMANILGKQGLMEDIVRGLTTTSPKKRYSIQYMVGIFRDPLINVRTSQKGKYGEAGREVDILEVD